jgi:hypothetical protein
LRFSQEKVSKSGEFLKSTLSNIAGIMLAPRTAPPAAEEDDVEVAKPEIEVEPVHREARIRTLRGMNRGLVRVELISAGTQDTGHTPE